MNLLKEYVGSNLKVDEDNKRKLVHHHPYKRDRL